MVPKKAPYHLVVGKYIHEDWHFGLWYWQIIGTRTQSIVLSGFSETWEHTLNIGLDALSKLYRTIGKHQNVDIQ